MNRRVGFRASAAASASAPEPAPAAAPAPALPFGAAVSSEMFGFCIFCGTPLNMGARLCSACGRRTRALA
jgi:hypothetical protein